LREDRMITDPNHYWIR